MREKKTKIEKDLFEVLKGEKSDGKNVGITLIALVITVIILLILAGVSINFMFGNEGIFNKSQEATQKYQNAQVQEEALIAKISNSVKSNRDDSEEIDLLKQEIALLKNETAELKKAIVPVGTIISYYGNTAPTGYLACDGTIQEVSKYEDLAKFLGVDTNTVTTFNLPNLQGEFLRGAGTNSHTNQGSGASVGVHQDGTFLARIYCGSISEFWYDANANTNLLYGEDSSWRRGTYTRNYYHRNGSDAPGKYGDMGLYYSFKPTNTSVLYCIKF